MRISLIIILIIFLVFSGAEVYSFWQRGRSLERGYERLEKELTQAEHDRSELQADLNYYANMENLEKELRARFNYRARDEKLIIVVPEQNQVSPKASSTAH